MKYFETQFNEYLKSYKTNPLHKNIDLPDNFNDLSNYIIYGPPGVGKYSYVLNLIQKYSNSKLNYEKKLSYTYNKNVYNFKISDIHYEVDMGLLGCNSKIIWHEIYNLIIDIISAKNEKNGIILCKNFSNIHNELLEVFYSYMQKMFIRGITIKFIIILDNISFIPENILNCCKRITLSRPFKNNYNKISKNFKKVSNFNQIINIKDYKNNNLLPYLKNNTSEFNPNEILYYNNNYINLCDNIINQIVNYENLKYTQLRENLYDICIYDLNLYDCLSYIINKLIILNLIDNNKFNLIINNSFNLFNYYNNNYRPIYHLEKYILYIISVIHEI